jgi:hypothetical protein
LEEPTCLGQRPPLRGTVNGGIVKTQDTDDFLNFLVACGKFSEKIRLKKTKIIKFAVMFTVLLIAGVL